MIDTLHDRFKGEIVDPWIKKLREEGGNALLGTTKARFMAAKNLVTSPLFERRLRYKRELDEKENLIGEERVEHPTGVYSNLLVAEGALEELLVPANTSDEVTMDCKVWTTTSDSLHSKYNIPCSTLVEI